jgi:hypothetical protein
MHFADNPQLDQRDNLKAVTSRIRPDATPKTAKQQVISRDGGGQSEEEVLDPPMIR